MLPKLSTSELTDPALSVTPTTRTSPLATSVELPIVTFAELEAETVFLMADWFQVHAKEAVVV